ncbi:MAG TPA: hypothetical protein VFZ42_07405 [Chitinophagaceae bacterium]
MSGRAGNNKQGSGGSGSNKQSSQPFVNESGAQQLGDHNRNQTGGEPSVKKPKSTDVNADRNAAVAVGKVKTPRVGERQFNLVVDDVPYMVKATPFTFNTETRYYISVNEGEEHVFTWDSELSRLRAIDDEASILPDALEEAISTRLQSR